VVPVIAAFLGAVVGGVLSILASRAATHDEWRLDRQEDLNRLLKRVASNLRRMQKLGDRVQQHKSEEPLPADVGDGLEVIWNTYYRVADPIFSLDNDDLSERIDDFFQEVRRTGVLIREIEDTAKVASAQPWGPRRAKQIEAIVALGEQAKGLLAEIAPIDPVALAKRRRERESRR
jgi:hypothetical protein